MCVCSEKSPSNSGPLHIREALCHIHSRPIIRVCDSRTKKKNQRNESSCRGAVSEGANAITFCWHFSADYFSSVVSLLAFFRSLLSLLKYSVYTQWAIKIIVGYYKTNSYIYKIRSERKDEKIYRKWNYTAMAMANTPWNVLIFFLSGARGATRRGKAEKKTFKR